MLLASVTAIVLVVAFAAATAERARDPATGCPAGAPIGAAHTVIVVDQSDSYSERQIQYAQTVILLEYNRLQRGEKLTVIGLSSNPDAPERVFSKCRLRRGGDVLGVASNPHMIEEEFNRVVGADLSRFVNDLATVPPAEMSPILETIASMLDAIDFSAGAPHRRLVLISDMAQHSAAVSNYGRAGAVAVDEEVVHRFRRDLSSVQVRVHYLRRNDLAEIQTSAHEAFWRGYFASSGASDVELGWGPELVEARPPPGGLEGLVNSIYDATDEILHGRDDEGYAS